MINEVDQMTIPIILSNASQKAYEKFKKLVLRIFSLLKKNQCNNNIKEEFYNSYIDFARKLDAEGYHEESNLYMSICEMYYRLIDRPDELIDYESFFTDLFDAFDDLLYVKIHEPSDYDEKFEEFIRYSGEMQDFYYLHLAQPSNQYDEDTLYKIIHNLAGDLNDF